MANAGAGEAANLPVLGTDTSSGVGAAVRTRTFGFAHGLGQVLVRERNFLVLVGLMFLVAGLTAGTPSLAMWIGFAFASYSVVANDSVQTLGTFIASNRNAKWWVLWLFIGGIFLATVLYSWFAYDGDVSYQRLQAKGFSTAPTSFSFLQVAAPVFLLIITRLRMPVSTTFLILSCFSASSEGFTSMVAKSFAGYGVAFGVALLLWLSLSRAMNRWFTGEARKGWRVAQWMSTAFLWSVWLMQDAANVAVYLPRTLGSGEFIAFAGVLFLGLGIIFYLRGDRIQEVVNEKSQVVDVRPATIIDVVYGAVLYYFKVISNVPMSTTWVFIGLLAGREIGMSVSKASGRSFGAVSKMIGRDLAYVTVGLIISVILAVSINEGMRRDLYVTFGLN